MLTLTTSVFPYFTGASASEVAPRADVLRGSSRVPAPLVGQERITNPKEQDIRPATERLRERLLSLRFLTERASRSISAQFLI